MQPVEASHHLQVGRRHRTWQVVDTATADAQNLRLLGDRQIVLTVDHRFALSNPALVSAPSKKSFSSVNSPILAWSDFTSTPAGQFRGYRRDRIHRRPLSQAAPSTKLSDFDARRNARPASRVF